MASEESLKRYSRAYGTRKENAPKDLDKLLRQQNEQLKMQRKQLTDLQKRLDAAEDLRDSVFGLTVADFGPPRWPTPKPIKGRSIHTPILFTSDKQYGEVIDAAEMDGMNKFNKHIFAERYSMMIDKSIRWADAIGDGWGAVYPRGIIYLRGGDEISGEIHAELAETNDAGAVPGVIELAAHEVEGIKRLKDRFGRVHVISIPGNHGRTTIKPRHKGYTSANFETILAWLIQAKFEGDPNVTFETPTSGISRFNAEGWSFELRHGDRMGAGGGTGWIGSSAPITKGHKKIRLDAASVGAPVDFVLTGHLHTSIKLPRGFANGSMPGYNEFARSFGLEPDSAKQWFLMAHAERVYGMELELSPFPRRGLYT
jgi:hypothetical protein